MASLFDLSKVGLAAGQAVGSAALRGARAANPVFAAIFPSKEERRRREDLRLASDVRRQAAFDQRVVRNLAAANDRTIASLQGRFAPGEGPRPEDWDWVKQNADFQQAVAMNELLLLGRETIKDRKPETVQQFQNLARRFDMEVSPTEKGWRLTVEPGAAARFGLDTNSVEITPGNAEAVQDEVNKTGLRPVFEALKWRRMSKVGAGRAIAQTAASVAAAAGGHYLDFASMLHKDYARRPPDEQEEIAAAQLISELRASDYKDPRPIAELQLMSKGLGVMVVPGSGDRPKDVKVRIEDSTVTLGQEMGLDAYEKVLRARTSFFSDAESLAVGLRKVNAAKVAQAVEQTRQVENARQAELTAGASARGKNAANTQLARDAVASALRVAQAKGEVKARGKVESSLIRQRAKAESDAREQAARLNAGQTVLSAAADMVVRKNAARHALVSPPGGSPAGSTGNTIGGFPRDGKGKIDVSTLRAQHPETMPVLSAFTAWYVSEKSTRAIVNTRLGKTRTPAEKDLRTAIGALDKAVKEEGVPPEETTLFKDFLSRRNPSRVPSKAKPANSPLRDVARTVKAYIDNAAGR